MKEKTSRLLTFLYTTSVGNRLLRILVSPAVSKAAGCVMNSRLSLIAVSGFIKSQNIDVSEFEKTSFSSYNDFFTRKLKPQDYWRREMIYLSVHVMQSLRFFQSRMIHAF